MEGDRCLAPIPWLPSWCPLPYVSFHIFCRLSSQRMHTLWGEREEYLPQRLPLPQINWVVALLADMTAPVRALSKLAGIVGGTLHSPSAAVKAEAKVEKKHGKTEWTPLDGWLWFLNYLHTHLKWWASIGNACSDMGEGSGMHKWIFLLLLLIFLRILCRLSELNGAP